MTTEANYPVAIEKNLPMRARDGVTLMADVYRPAAPGRFPVLVIRTPYDKSADNALTEKNYFPPRGYVVVVQDTRGRFAGGGRVLSLPARGRRRLRRDRMGRAIALVQRTRRDGRAVVHGGGAVRGRGHKPAASRGAVPGVRFDELFRKFDLAARRVRTGLPAQVFHHDGARDADASGAL